MDEEEARQGSWRQVVELAQQGLGAVSMEPIKQIAALMAGIEGNYSVDSDGDMITLTAKPAVPAEPPAEIGRDSVVLFKEGTLVYVVDRVGHVIVGHFRPEGLYTVFLTGEYWESAMGTVPAPYDKVRGWMTLRDADGIVDVQKACIVHESDVLAVMNNPVSE